MKNPIKNYFLVCSVIAIVVLAIFVPMQAQAANATDYSAVFDANYYYNAYPDLRNAIGYDPEGLLQHFISFGMQEGRHGNAEFDVRAYMANNPDLIQAFGAENLVSYYLHYITYGKAEGRSAVYAGGNQRNEVSKATVISTYSTSYDQEENRAINIGLAAGKINGTVVKPGESFSFSDTVGSRTAQNGFVEAPSFANKKVVISIGGGICQVSSTLYAAMLGGGIPATQRYPHSLPVDYVPEGMDAAIAEGQKDLKFTNTFNFPIVISAVAKDGVVSVSLSRM